MRASLDALIDREQRNGTRGDTDQEVKAWLDRIGEADKLRRGFQEQAAKGLITLEELQDHLSERDEIRETACVKPTLKGSCRRLEELEHDQEALMEPYADLMPEVLENLLSEERR